MTAGSLGLEHWGFKHGYVHIKPLKIMIVDGRVERAKLCPCGFRVLCLGYGWMYFRQTERVLNFCTVCLLALVVGQDIYEYSTLDKQNAINFCSE